MPPTRRITHLESQRGVALVLVLSLLVLVAGLTIALLQTVRTEAAVSAGFERGVSTRTIAETAVNLVIGQIQEATERPDEAWISQPGLIRTFNTSGNPATAYKLYSAEKMLIEGEFDPNDAVDLPADTTTWKTDPNRWVDLNEPIKTVGSSATPHFLYPIIDPRAKGNVEGFDYDANWSSNTTASESLALPVRWLYLLEDGTLTPAGTGSRGEVTIPGSTPSNPPIARIAFWTDDETSKVNVNTASEGTYWDTPIANTWPSAAGVGVKAVSSGYIPDPRYQYELDLAWFQGRQREYQRYPGHPATTSLLPVLGKPLADGLGIAYPPSASERRDLVAALYDITPRFTDELSSEGGTVSIRQNLPPGGAMPVKTDRLYASLDEVLFDPGQPNDPRGKQGIGASDAEAAKILQQSGFFLTATSRAPEVNLFDKPRVSIWPLTTPQGQPDSDARLTAFDKLIKFCSTVGNLRYAFTRSDPDSPTQDLLGTPRNLQIYDYLQRLTSRSVPGFGGSFSAKYGVGERDQILTQIVDFIRCTNLVDVSTSGVAFTTPGGSSQGQVVPLEGPNGTRGFGRIATVSEVAVAFKRTHPETVEDEVPVYRLEVILLPELFSPMAGFSAMARNITVRFSNLNNFLVDGNPIFSTNQVDMVGSGIASGSNESLLGGHLGPFTLLKNSTGLPPHGKMSTSQTNAVGQTFTFGGSFTVEVLAATTVIQEINVTFPTTTLNLPPLSTGSIRPGYNKTPPSPNPPRVSSEWITGSGASATLSILRPDREVRQILDSQTVARSVSPSKPGASGDMRIVAGRTNPSILFDKTGSDSQYNTASERRITTLRQIRGAADGNFFGKLVAGQPDVLTGSAFDFRADVPPGVDGVKNILGSAGDWDNGPALIVDGAFLNKPDEGTVSSHSGGTTGVTVPYIGHRFMFERSELATPTVFSPNRQVPSPVIFGSLPTGVNRGHPWQTILFRPNAHYLPGGGNHPGGESAPDHLLLDLFWMPIVEPYAISEPFSTAGKVNLNYQIAPFTYVTRQTGIHALLETLKMPALNPNARPGGSTNFPFGRDYKIGGKDDPAARRSDGTWPGQDVLIRRKVDVVNTLSLMNERFIDNKPFISASEICEIPLVPKDIPNTNGAFNMGLSENATASQIESRLQAFWNNHKLTGDNSLERPYAHLYPRLTTQSNTYTVHVRVQRLVVTPLSLEEGIFDSNRDKVTGEFRGSFTIERYLDPNTDSLVKKQGNDYVPAGENDPEAFLGPYKVRVINSKRLSL